MSFEQKHESTQATLRDVSPFNKAYEILTKIIGISKGFHENIRFLSTELLWYRRWCLHAWLENMFSLAAIMISKNFLNLHA